MFLLQNKGIEYVDDIQKEKEDATESDNYTTILLENDYLLETIAAKSVEYSGFTQTEIVFAMKTWILKNPEVDVNNLSGEYLIDILIDIDENCEDCTNVQTDPSCKINGEERKNIFSDGNETITNRVETDNPREGSFNSNDNFNVNEIESIIAEHAHAKEEELCHVCKEEPKQIALLPCGDIVACRLCSMALYDCPECNQRVKATVRVYFS